ncbi:FemAB family protein [Flavobacterium piscinae]|uniref:FemAB family protein n=1 Tax=Flavobacterium piscinae TaxID=2506424 RepID=UPI001FE8E7DF|nr:FemAB family protein [Flavobacterium piscinae]
MLKFVPNYTIRKYTSADNSAWNEFIALAKNATFLFHRDFMDYHQDRFEDYSLIVEDGKSWVAVLPANRIEDTLFSHQGLTYGGVVIKDNFERTTIITIFESLKDYLKTNQFRNFFIKPILPFYTDESYFEMEYSLVQKKADLYRKDINLFIDFKSNYSISKSKLKHFRRVSSLGLEIREDANFQLFWNHVLIPRLKEKHNANPVHTVEEIIYLHSKFPENIKQFNVYFENEILAGITLFVFKNGVKSQYGATTSLGEKMRALDFLFITLLNEYKDKFDFFDMGTVSENQGNSINQGLLKQKQELGCSISEQNYYSFVL